MYKRKTKDIYIIMTNYGYGWEEESSADSLKEAMEQAKEYRMTSCAPAVRIIAKRERI